MSGPTQVDGHGRKAPRRPSRRLPAGAVAYLTVAKSRSRSPTEPACNEPFLGMVVLGSSISTDRWYRAQAAAQRGPRLAGGLDGRPATLRRHRPRTRTLAAMQGNPGAATDVLGHRRSPWRHRATVALESRKRGARHGRRGTARDHQAGAKGLECLAPRAPRKSRRLCREVGRK